MKLSKWLICFPMGDRNEIDNLFDAPNMVCDSRFHSWGYPQCLMDTAKIVMHEVQCDSGLVILDLLGEGIGQSSEAAHTHPHGQILTFRITGRDVIGVWTTANDRCAASNALRRTVPRLRL